MQGDISRAKQKERLRVHSGSSFSNMISAVDEMKIDDVTNTENNNTLAYRRPLQQSTSDYNMELSDVRRHYSREYCVNYIMPISLKMYIFYGFF